jgi:hypothetical protein
MNSYNYSGAGNLTLDYNGTTSHVGALADVGGACSVDVTAGLNGGLQTVKTNDANSFTGSLTVRDNAVFSAITQTAPDGSPFGANTSGAVNLYGGDLELKWVGDFGASYTKGDLTIRGPAGIWLWYAAMKFNSIQRPDHGTLSIKDEAAVGASWAGWNTVSVTSNANHAVDVTATNTGAGGNGMVAPWMVGSTVAGNPAFFTVGGGSFFLTYVASGFTPANFTQTDLSGGATDVVNLASGAAVSGPVSAYAVRTAGALTSTLSTDVLTIGSGGLILDTAVSTDITHSANIAFGSAEGVIYIGGNSRINRLTGALTGNGGLTISAPSGVRSTGNDNTYLYIPNSNTGLSGQIAIDNALVIIGKADSLGTPSTSPIYLNNNPGLDPAGYNNLSLLQGGLGASSGITIANTITLGPLGGELTDTSSSFTVSGQITGGGTLYVSGNSGRAITFSNTGTGTSANNWSGGTWVMGTILAVNSGVVLGSGPIVIGSGAASGSVLRLLGTGNIATLDRVILDNNADDLGSGVQIWCASQTFGSVEGIGRVQLGGADKNGYYGNVALTVGGNGLSTDFYGTIADNSQNNVSGVGSLTKTGGGTLTLWGETFLAGTVEVSGGTLTVNGSVGSPISTAGDLTVNTNGTLNGSGAINRNLTVSGGAVNFSGATVNGSFSMDSGSYSGSSTINDGTNNGITISGGTFSGTHTINTISVFLEGGTFSSSGTINLRTGTARGNAQGFYVNRDSNEGGDVSGNATINGDIYLWGHSFTGVHTIVGNVDVEDYNGDGSTPVFSGTSDTSRAT